MNWTQTSSAEDAETVTPDRYVTINLAIRSMRDLVAFLQEMDR